MPEENEIIAKFVADIDQYKAQIAQMGVVNEKAAASTDSVTKSTDKLSARTKSASGSISTLSKGLAGMTGLLGVTGRLFGVNTDKIEALVFASQQFVRVGQDIARTQKLAATATQSTTTATVALTTAERILNAVRSASMGGITLLITGVVALGAAILNYIRNVEAEERALKRKQAIDKEQININKQLAESISKRNEQEAETLLNAAVRKGQITEQQAEEIALNDKFFKERIRIDKVIEQQRFEASKANQDAFGRLSLADQARLNENRRKLEEEAEATLQAGRAEVREKFAKIEADEAKKEAERKKKEAIQRQKELDEAVAKQRLEDLRAQIRVNADILKAEEDALKKKAEEEEEINRRNREDDELNAQLRADAAKKEKEAAEKRRQERIEAEQKMLDIISNAYQEAFDKRQALLDEERTEQEKAIEVQRSLAERGLTNTLAFEEKRAAELKRQQQKEKENAKKVKLLETFLNSLAEFSKTDPKTALQKALLQVALATAATAVFAEEGGVIGEIGDRSNLRRKHRGGGDVLLHAQTGEGILSRKEMDNLGRRNFHLLKDAARFPIRDNVFAMPNVALGGSVATISNAEVVKELRDLKHIIKNKRETHYDLKQNGEYMITQFENGVKEVTKGKLRKPRFRS